MTSLIRGQPNHMFALFTALLVGIAACNDASADPALPSAPEPAFSVNSGCACAVWSCTIGDCGYDPAIYGACCVECSENGQGTQRPSCESPPFCEIHPTSCE